MVSGRHSDVSGTVDACSPACAIECYPERRALCALGEGPSLVDNGSTTYELLRARGDAAVWYEVVEEPLDLGAWEKRAVLERAFKALGTKRRAQDEKSAEGDCDDEQNDDGYCHVFSSADHCALYSAARCLTKRRFSCARVGGTAEPPS